MEVLWALRFTGRVRRAKSRGLRSMTAANGSLHVPLEASGDGAGGTLKGTPAGSTPSSPTALQGEAGIVMWSGINPLHGSRSDGPGGRGDPGSERQANAPPQSLPPPPPPPSHVPEDELDGTQWSATIRYTMGLEAAERTAPRCRLLALLPHLRMWLGDCPPSWSEVPALWGEEVRSPRSAGGMGPFKRHAPSLRMAPLPCPHFPCI